MEPRRPLFRHGCARAEARPRKGGGRLQSPSRAHGRASSPPRRPRLPKPGLANALREYEALDELIGRIVSYAALVYAGNTTDPQRAKLYGDIQEKMTDASAHLLFFALELNLVDDAADRRGARRQSGVRPLSPVGARPQDGQALSARRPHRAIVPRKVDHRARRLEPPVRRDHGRSALRRRRRAAGARAGAEPLAGRRSAIPAARPPRRWRQPSRRTSACSR